MSFIKKIQERFNTTVVPAAVPQPVTQPPTVKHEFCNFETAYRIGLLSLHTEQDIVNEYKKKLEKLGFEVDALLYIDSQEPVPGLFLSTYNYEDLDKRTLLPNGPRTDRFCIKRFDLLLNLYFKPYPQLVHVSNMSHAKCRVGPYIDNIKDYVDLMMPMDNIRTIPDLIETINTILKLRPYERKLD